MKQSPPALPYYQTQEFSAMLGGGTVRFISKPGLPDWNLISPDVRLLAELVEAPERGRILLLGCGHGALAVSLAQQAPQAELWLKDAHLIALRMAGLTLQANGVNDARIWDGASLPPEQSEAFEAVVIDLPKGRRLAQRWLAEAAEALRPGGRLYLAGAKDEGIQPVINDAGALFGEPSILGYKKGNRVACFINPESPLPQPVWMAASGVQPGSWVEFEIETPGGPVHLSSLPGVFSSGGLDDGSALLLPLLERAKGRRTLDLGCGYGLLGLLAARLGAPQVDLVDENLLAVAAAEKNLRDHRVANASAFPSDALSDVLDQRYDLVVTNPPFHSGKAVDYQMTQAFMRGAWEVLDPEGCLLLVANHFIPYDKVMKELFGSVETLAETGRYKVLLAEK